MADETRRLDISAAELSEAVLKVIEHSEQIESLQAEITALKGRVSALESTQEAE